MTSNPKPLRPVPTFSAPGTGNYTDAVIESGIDMAIPAPALTNYTPVGKGLDQGFGIVDPADNNYRKVVLLLTDGLHNRPTSDTPLLPDKLSYNPCGATSWVAECATSTVQVSTVAFGGPGTVDEAMLDKIRLYFGGTIAGMTYNISTDPEAVKYFFLQSLDDLYATNLACPGVDCLGAPEFDVTPGEGKLIVIQSWEPPTGATQFFLQQKSSAGVAWPAWPAGQQTCAVQGTENVTVGFAVCVIDRPPPGRWRAVDSGGFLTAPTRQFVLLDLNLGARFAIAQKEFGTGDRIRFTADIREAGAPVTHDPATHPVDVRVLISRPGESAGTYVSVHTFDSCEPRPPTLPPVPRDLRVGRTGANSAGPVVPATAADPKPDRFAKVDSLFHMCAKDSLVYVEDPGLQLVDDGTGSDDTANDGVYTGDLPSTQFDGSYVFRFHASGVSPSGGSFSRVKTLATYVRVEVTPERSEVASRLFQHSGNTVVRQYYVIPRDRYNNYLGPGFPFDVRFRTTAGAFVGPVVDHLNGIYSQLLRFDESQQRPLVGAIVQGKEFKPVDVFKAFELVPFVGGTFLDNALGLDQGIVIGARGGYRLTNALTLEAEAGATPTKTSGGDSGALLQGMVGLRFDLYRLHIGEVIPFVASGVGIASFRGFAANDETAAYQVGVGSTFRIRESIGLRLDARLLGLGSVFGAGATTNPQMTAGLVWRP